MEELNELVELAKECDDIGVLMYRIKPNDILAIAEAFRELQQEKIAAEHERDCHMDIAEHFKEQCRALTQRAEAAEALNNHLELAVRKSEGVSESLRRRAEDAENKLLFTRPAPAVSLAELVQGEMSFEDALQECREMPGVVAKSFQAGANWRRLQILRNIEEAK